MMVSVASCFSSIGLFKGDLFVGKYVKTCEDKINNELDIQTLLQKVRDSYEITKILSSSDLRKFIKY